MNTGVIVLIILLVVVLLTGLGVGGYFWYKSTQKTTQSGGNNNNGGNNGGGNNNNGGGGGNNGGGGGNIVQGNFSIQSVFDNSYMTYSPGTTNSVPITISSTSSAINCGKYSWQNIANFQNGTNNVVASALVSNFTPASAIPGFQNTPQPSIAVNGLISPNTSYTTIVTQNREQTQGLESNSSWTYNPNNKTWCATQFPDYCLYNNNIVSSSANPPDNSTVNVTMNSITTNPSDTRFQWNNVAPITTCTT